MATCWKFHINGGAFMDILAAGGSFVTGGYNVTISGCRNNSLEGRMGWGHNSGGYITTTVNLGATSTVRRSSCASAWAQTRPSPVQDGASTTSLTGASCP